MYNGYIDICGIMLYRDEALEQGKSGDYISALDDLINILKKNKESFEMKQKKNLEKLQKRRNDSISDSPVTLYFYKRMYDGCIIKEKYEAVEKKNSYELKDCFRRRRLYKDSDINKYVDSSHNEMWTDNENDELMEELLKYW